MRPLPLLLHVLLSLALLANGIGAAMASAHAGCAHSATAAAPSGAGSSTEQPSVDEPPCHDDMAAEAAAPMQDTGHTSLPGDTSSTHAHDSGDDCGGACTCDCTAHCQAALMPPTPMLHASARIAHAEAAAYTHATPALPHPIRPPIA